MTYIDLYTECFNLVDGYWCSDKDLIDLLDNMNQDKRSKYIIALMNHKPKYVFKLLHIFEKYFALEHYDELIIMLISEMNLDVGKLRYLTDDMKESFKARLIKSRHMLIKKVEKMVEDYFKDNEIHIKDVVMGYLY